MLRHAAGDEQVLRAIVALVSVSVVDDLARQRPSPEHLLGDKAMLVDVAGHVGAGVIGQLHPHIACEEMVRPPFQFGFRSRGIPFTAPPPGVR